MREIINFVLIILLCVSFFSFFKTEEVFADCAFNPNDRSMFAGNAITYSDIVVLGEVKEVKKDPKNKFVNPSYIVDFEVEKSWKKKTPKNFSFGVNTYSGLQFEEGKRHLVYLSGENGHYSTDMCYIALINPTEEEIKEMDSSLESFIPEEKENIEEEVFFYIEWHIHWIVLIGIFAIIVILACISKRKKKKEKERKRKKKKETKKEMEVKRKQKIQKIKRNRLLNS